MQQIGQGGSESEHNSSLTHKQTPKNEENSYKKIEQQYFQSKGVKPEPKFRHIRRKKKKNRRELPEFTLDWVAKTGSKIPVYRDTQDHHLMHHFSKPVYKKQVRRMDLRDKLSRGSDYNSASFQGPNRPEASVDTHKFTPNAKKPLSLMHHNDYEQPESKDENLRFSKGHGNKASSKFMPATISQVKYKYKE